jgi:nitrite reductase/ring-hydroxylating ferredoxin subunit
MGLLLHWPWQSINGLTQQCPHSSYPLSQGIPFDIEDFGIVLSAGLTCPKHNWSFDLFSGRSDRGNYKLKVWEVELREIAGTSTDDREVWVRRKPRIG